MNISSFQQKLKEQTTAVHQKAEQHELMQSFIQGTYTKEHLLQFLVNIYPIYSVVEQRLLVSYFKDVPELKRTHLIENDIVSLTKEVEEINNKNILTPLDCTCGWVSNSWEKPIDLLKADLYSRWLADLYGGRMLKMMLFPHAMYEADEPIKIITTVREILDTPNINSNITNDDIIDEVVCFFDFHLELFDHIYNGSTQ
jgi:heme oxygenase